MLLPQPCLSYHTSDSTQSHGEWPKASACKKLPRLRSETVSKLVCVPPVYEHYRHHQVMDRKTLSCNSKPD